MGGTPWHKTLTWVFRRKLEKHWVCCISPARPEAGDQGRGGRIAAARSRNFQKTHGSGEWHMLISPIGHLLSRPKHTRVKKPDAGSEGKQVLPPVLPVIEARKALLFPVTVLCTAVLFSRHGKSYPDEGIRVQFKPIL